MLILSQEDVAQLVGLSDDIKKARLRRVKGLQVRRPILIVVRWGIGNFSQKPKFFSKSETHAL
jgi:hypothetical protein